jgi:hypothetical protein
MNSGVKLSDLDRFRSCFGLCVICGQILGTKVSHATILSNQRQNDGDDLNEYDEESSASDKKSKKKNTESNTKEILESTLLTEECSIRLALNRFNMLGERQNCHVIDQYTFLDKNIDKTSFKYLFSLYQDQIIKIDPVFSQLLIDLEKSSAEGESQTVYEVASATCKRVADGFTISGCRRCNLAMNRPIVHCNAIYRCYQFTHDKDITKLESNTLESINIKKVIQQIALYFDYVKSPSSTKQSKSKSKKELPSYVWVAKSRDKLVLEAALWRCIAHLCAWGVNGQFRFRLIAIFHASQYLYEISSIKWLVDFEEWHLHIFRNFYMEAYEDSNTWFGMTQRHISITFDLSQKNGLEWVDMVKTTIEYVGDALEKIYALKDFNKIQQFKDAMVRQVKNEETLLRFVSNKQGITRGVDRLFSFFKYNISAPEEIPLLTRCRYFESELCKAYTNKNKKIFRY